MYRNTLGIWLLFRSRITTDTFCPSAGSFSFRSHSLFLVFAACFIAYQYQREKEYKVELLDMQLQDYNDRLHQELRYLPDSLWTSMLDSYISKHVNKELRVTVVDLHGNVLFDSSQNDSHELDNHIKRPEVQKALKDGKGYDLRRISETTARPISILPPPTKAASPASALPLQRQSDDNLAADPHYIWFTVIVSLLLISVFYKFTSKLGSAINHLREFAKRADKNEPIDMDIQAAFPHNELGEISQHIIQIYKRLRETKEALYIEREKLITHLQTSREGLGVFNRDKKEILVNNLFTQYGNLISDSNLQATEEIFSICEFQKITDFTTRRRSAPPTTKNEGCPYTSTRTDAPSSWSASSSKTSALKFPSTTSPRKKSKYG